MTDEKIEVIEEYHFKNGEKIKKIVLVIPESIDYKPDFQNLYDGLITSLIELNDRVIALEELAAEYLAEQEAE